ncbi:hypothetical protein [Myxococcus sp. AB025B]|uniref:hypothetical protein n=1 Tax=Myxococcus sp. AB025B TaxID=2562794 RepID=UPI00114400E0|nr:hypothetical protein [Myxococcus sp. AB025B]
MFKYSAKLACVVALVLSGCGGAPEQQPPSETETLESSEQGLIWACDGRRSFNRYWTVNGVEVGREYCDCDGTLTEFGTLSGRYSQTLNFYCR